MFRDTLSCGQYRGLRLGISSPGQGLSTWIGVQAVYGIYVVGKSDRRSDADADGGAGRFGVIGRAGRCHRDILRTGDRGRRRVNTATRNGTYGGTQ